jgi:hypothetical protein
MKAQNYSLQPFPGTDTLPDLEISGLLSRRADTLLIRYLLVGAIIDIELPAPSKPAARRIGLWEKTCLEFFLAQRGSPGYWEFNLSPSGDWNIYRFEVYRQGLYEEPAFTALPFKVRKQSDSLLLELEFDLGQLLPADRVLEAAVSAVIMTKEGQETFWALAHPGKAPDFHSREGFIVQL